jgi:hypothetical protein
VITLFSTFTERGLQPHRSFALVSFNAIGAVVTYIVSVGIPTINGKILKIAAGVFSCLVSTKSNYIRTVQCRPGIKPSS